MYHYHIVTDLMFFSMRAQVRRFPDETLLQKMHEFQILNLNGYARHPILNIPINIIAKFSWLFMKSKP